MQEVAPLLSVRANQCGEVSVQRRERMCMHWVCTRTTPCTHQPAGMCMLVIPLGLMLRMTAPCVCQSANAERSLSEDRNHCACTRHAQGSPLVHASRHMHSGPCLLTGASVYALAGARRVPIRPAFPGDVSGG